MTQLRLYDYAASANCFKVRLLLNQLGLDWERVEVDIFAGDTLTPAFAAVNPLRETPVLEIDGREHLVESNAILIYLADGSPLLPDDRLERARVVRWLLFEQTEVMSTMGGLRFRLQTGRLAPDAPDAIRRRAAALSALTTLDGHLRTTPFLVGGRYSIADIAVFAYAHRAGEAGLETAPFAAFGAWLKRVEAQPAFLNDLLPYPPNASERTGRSIYG